MELIKLKKRTEFDQNKKLNSEYAQFSEFINHLNKKELPNEIISSINRGIEAINTFTDSEKELRKLISKTQSRIINLLEKELKLVTKNHYRNTWLAVGMAVFGVPLGVALGTSLGNMGLMGIGLPIGMLIGMAIGSSMDKKACDEGRQLDLEII
ncbi:hypothetical protein [Ancylomarina sp. 16SWW S1-10-2]|uniref:hypothetical protein n=1 Tax=Ancylomarina sp. 16SWW S1-10-2 TaxID=2499681 RepID=UPI0012ADB9E1|nr:hypothetical protein [Ancylomarina sp. 16SWW S1-10-2]